MLQAALSLSGGREEDLREWLDRMESEEQGSKDDLEKLIDAAGLGEPAVRSYPNNKMLSLCEAAAKIGKLFPYLPQIEGLEATRTWTEGRTLSEWIPNFIRFALAGLLHGRISVAAVLNHIDKVARIVNDTSTRIPGREERYGL